MDKLINAILLSNSAKPLLNIDVTKNVFCLGMLPIIVCTPLGDKIVISSPILRFKEKLSSLPIEIEFFSKLILFPLKFFFL